jgi:MFS transporter, DHA2 family, multidrug resistance protein
MAALQHNVVSLQAPRKVRRSDISPVIPLPLPQNVPPPAFTPLTSGQKLLVTTGLTGSFLVNLSAQFVTTNIADLQGGIGATPDEASWISTVYTMASFAGIIASGPLIKTFGLRRYLIANALLFSLAALACLLIAKLDAIIAFRFIQGLAAGAFGPVAFISVFMVMSGRRLPLGLTLLGFVLLCPGTLGPTMAGYIEDSFGWRSFFFIQLLIGAALVTAAICVLPKQPVSWSGLSTDWMAILMLSAALGFLVVVLSQGTRRFWFDNDMIVWCTAACVSAWAGFIFLCRFSPLPIIAPRLLLARSFGIPIALNLVFRAGFVVTGYLVPLFLGTIQGYRPLQVAGLLGWAVIAQLAILPVVWTLLQRFDGRLVMGFGLLLCGIGTALGIAGTGSSSGEQFQAMVIVFAVGQLFFLVPDLLIGVRSLTPPDLPTASLAFNMTTLGGTTLGTALVSHLVTEREKFHSNILTENLSLYDPAVSDRIAGIAASLGSRFVDDAAATARAVSLVGLNARKEAWVLAFNDGFLAVAVILTISAAGVLAIGKSPALRYSTTGEAK